ncbi:DUF6477 family protein [Falsirhodobacter halotolerans]|uniref:DUF6477 family protein n=1 Tax=Falsirhodobacter halotolerans TaxID=1146892 RepID=UPI001FCF9CD7|nr:DUF6477 family protein [Falsirhodobacter halotolerans]MCJ8139257.1 DUF6477 family protein [Falsirhodobacter halotolerans]
MTDFRAILATLRRPRLLIRAARLGMEDYRRDRDLGRLTDCPTPESALPRLLEQEDLLERTRLSGDAAYSVTRHVEVMIALMAEARMQPRSAPALTLV